MNTADINYQANRYLTYSIHFLCLAETVFTETIKKRNAHIVSSFKRIDTINYDEETKWSDFNIILPTLFTFYHGLELAIKGLLILSGENPKTNHTLTSLFNKLETNLVSESELLKILETYISLDKLKNTPLGKWLQKNKLTINDLYEMLRYPTNKSKSMFTDNFPLNYQGERSLPFFGNLILDSKKLRVLTVSYYREISGMNNP